MTIGEYEAIAIGLMRIRRVVAQHVLPKRVGNGRERHRRAWVARVGGLHAIHRQRADSVDGEIVDRGSAQWRASVLNWKGGRGSGHGELPRVDSETRSARGRG